MLNKPKILIAGALALVLSASAAAQGLLEAVKPAFANGGHSLTVSGDGLSEPKVSSTNGGKTWKFTFSGKLKGKAGYTRTREAGLRYFTYGWQNAKPPAVFVCLYFSAAEEPKATETADGWTISWGEGSADWVGQAASSTPKATTKAADEEPDPAPATKGPKVTIEVNSKAPAAKPMKTIKPVGTPANSTASFPDSVPPLDFSKRVIPGEAGIAPAAKPADPMQFKVNLTFVSTDVVQILRALAQQAEVNIVTSPEVAGKITVALNQVTVQSALDLVSAMANLRYARMGNAFIVTSSSKFASAMQQIKGGADTPSESRVINLMSGEGNQIKLSVLKAIPQETMSGHYDLVLPSEKVAISQTQNQASTDVGAAGDDKAKGGQGGSLPTGQGTQGAASTALQTVSNDNGNGPTQANKDPYLVLVGTPDRLNEVETMVRDLDAKILSAARLGVTANIGTRVVPIYSMQTFRIREAVKALVDRDPSKDSYNITETQVTPVPGMAAFQSMLMISGPVEALDLVAEFARSFDRAICEGNDIMYPESQQDARQGVEVVELKFVEPIEVAYECQQRVHGLRASLLPGPVDPLMSGGTFHRKKDPELWERNDAKGSRVFGDGGVSASSTVSKSGGGEGGSGGSGGAGGGGGTKSGGSGNITSGQQGASMAGREMGYEPMKIMLHGTSQQIAAAKKLIDLMDVPPKVVAIEMRVMSLTKEEALRMGLDWSLLTGGTVKALRFNNGSGDTAASPGNISGTLGWAGGGSSDVLGTLDKLAGTNKMLARPNLLALHGKPTSLFIGDRIQYIKTIQASQNGTTITVGELNVGVEFNVVARVGAGGNLMLDLNPSLSILKGFTPVPGGGNLPQTTERYSQSQVVMKSGETLAIGGLIQDEDRKSVGGVPILSQIPLLGQLFSRTDNKRTRSEVVFFLTAKEVDYNERANAANPTSIKPDLK